MIRSLPDNHLHRN